MQSSISVAALLTLGSVLAAQQKPYSEGNVDAFLKNARANARPAVVLFNFDHDTG